MVLQLGTRRFLQAHVDTFAWQARESGQTVPDIAIVQVSDNAARAGGCRFSPIRQGFR